MGWAARGSYAFPPERRLRKRREFLRNRRRGRRLQGPRFIYYVRPAPYDRSRIGITVSKKVGKAVRRNRIKRRVREAFRQHPDLPRWPIDVVVIAKRGVDDFSYHGIRDEFVDVLTRYFDSEGSDGAPRSRRRRRRRGGRRRGRGSGGGGRGESRGEDV